MKKLAVPTLVPLLIALVAGCQSFQKLEAHDPEVSEQEVHAAGEADPDVEHLFHILDHASEYPLEVVVAAIAAVAERGEPGSVAHLAPLAADEDEEVRWHVARALHELGGPEAQALLDEMARDEESPLVLGAIAPEADDVRGQ